MQKVANMANWEDEQIEFVKEKVTQEGREEDLKKGKDPAQVDNLSNRILFCPIVNFTKDINYQYE